MAVILDGRKFADELKIKIRDDVDALSRFGLEVGLALLQCGENAASRQYFLATVKAAQKVGIKIYDTSFLKHHHLMRYSMLSILLIPMRG